MNNDDLSEKVALPVGTSEKAPTPSIDTVSMVKELVHGLLGKLSMEEVSRKVMETALHDYNNKLKLMLIALATHEMSEHHKILSGLSFALNYATDPDYIASLAKFAPDSFQRHMALLRKWHIESTELYKDLLGDQKRGSGDSARGDINKQFNIILGSAGSTVLPDSLKDPNKRRRLQALAGAIHEIMEGKSIPKPPQTKTRVVEIPEKGNES